MRASLLTFLACQLCSAAALAGDGSTAAQGAQVPAVPGGVAVVAPPARGWMDGARDAGSGTMRLMGGLAGYAASGKDAVAPYAAATVEAASGYGASALSGTVSGAYGAMAWGQAAALGGWDYSVGLMPGVPVIVKEGTFDATVLGISSRDLVFSAVTSGAVVGAAGYGCATLALPAGPAASAGAYFGCTLVGARVADWGLRAGYAEMGVEPDERAFAVGNIVGSSVGGWGSARSVGSNAARTMLKQYGAIPASSLQKGIPILLRQVGGTFMKSGMATAAVAEPAHAAAEGGLDGAAAHDAADAKVPEPTQPR